MAARAEYLPLGVVKVSRSSTERVDPWRGGDEAALPPPCVSTRTRGMLAGYIRRAGAAPDGMTSTSSDRRLATRAGSVGAMSLRGLPRSNSARSSGYKGRARASLVELGRRARRRFGLSIPRRSQPWGWERRQSAG